MSDYLWNKTGEPDEDVERLEQLLGALKFQPRPLEIPATALPTRPRTIFSTTRLAIAASLLLMLLAGTWLMIQRNERDRTTPVVAGKGSATGGDGQRETANVSRVGTDNTAVAEKPREVKSQDAGATIITTSAPRSQRASRQFVAKRQKLQPRWRENVSMPREEVAVNSTPQLQTDPAVTEEGREATEKLMVALRLASAKLNYAQRELKEISRTGN